MNQSSTDTRFIPAATIAEIGPGDIAELVARATASSAGRARICLHGDHADPVQEMVIALRRDAPIPAHRQTGGLRKSYHLLDGQLEVVFFAEDGSATKRVVLGTGEGMPPILTFPAGAWHACKALSPCAVYVETIAGPFDPGRTSWQRWMP